MRVFKTKPFTRFADHEGIGDRTLWNAARRAEEGVIDADLGGGVLKLRLARQGQGKSGGYRSIVIFRRGSVAFFVYGFAKKDRSNIRTDELRAFRTLAAEMLKLDDKALVAAMQVGAITEIGADG